MGHQTDRGDDFDWACPDCGTRPCRCPEDDTPEPGMCWCGAYGTYGQVHVAKPSPSEPPEECGRYL